ncbi:MAG: hypothetical protein AAFY69_06345 [Pseudomonadota bacterium]
MPYKRAWIGVFIMLLLSVAAFWRNYWGTFTTVPWQYHVHGLSATAWMLLLIAQSWSIHHGQRDLHKTAGLMTFAVIPVFTAGGLLVVGTMAAAPPGHPLYELFGDRLAAVDVISTAVFLWFIFEALRHRRRAGLHGGYMISTVFLLMAPTLGRLMPGFVPGLTIRSMDEIHRFGYGLHASHAISLIILGFLITRYRRFSRPFVIAAITIITQSIVFETLAKTDVWDAAMRAYASVPPMAQLLAGLGLGAAVALAGWRAGKAVPGPSAPPDIAQSAS